MDGGELVKDRIDQSVSFGRSFGHMGLPKNAGAWNTRRILN
jgi:hypothetical protein